MKTPDKKPNDLIHASSPYLLQHAYNPVQWQEWTTELLEKAATGNRMLIISIGYAACHWCHVMEHESFEDETVAEKMNASYINIKVDREERPDIDAVYMNAAQLTTGRGGWPLNVVALPDGRPVFAGTYFPKENWTRILDHFAEAWKNNREELEEVAGKIAQGLSVMENDEKRKATIQFNDSVNELDKEAIHRVKESIYASLDLRKGGLDKAPKFPMPVIFDFLLNYYYITQDEKIKDALHTTLVCMKEGGIYDQAGGGFARYSVDEYWFAPHFEKMLYDNGQLLSLYSKAYAYTGAEIYKETVQETIEWLKRDMLGPDGMFYSSLDADSEGVEGKYYCWTKEEIETIVPERPDIFAEYYSVEAEGNWEHSNILYIGKTAQEICKEFTIDRETFNKIISQGKQALLEAREHRVPPGLDDKCLTSWNGMAIIGLAHAWKFTGHKEALGLAQKALDFILEKMPGEEGLLLRNYKNGKAGISGFLDDQVFIIQACIDLYTCTWDEKYLFTAKALLEKVLEFYNDPERPFFYYTGRHQQQPVVRTREITDNVIPASNSILATVLYYLGHYFTIDAWIELSKKMCLYTGQDLYAYAPYHSQWANVMLAHTRSGIEVALTGPLDPQEIRELYKIPHLVLSRKTGTQTGLPLLEDKPAGNIKAVYICRDKACSLPINNIHESIHQIHTEIGR